jgi:hypothetical protein
MTATKNNPKHFKNYIDALHRIEVNNVAAPLARCRRLAVEAIGGKRPQLPHWLGGGDVAANLPAIGPDRDSTGNAKMTSPSTRQSGMNVDLSPIC